MQSFLFRHIPTVLILPVLWAADSGIKNPLPDSYDLKHHLFNSYSSNLNVSPLAIMHFNMGTTYAEEDQYELAIDAFKEALKEHPDFVGAMIAVDICYQKLGSNIRPDFSKLTVDDKLPLAEQYYIRAKQKIVNEDIALAILDFEKSLEQDPSHLKAQYNLGIAFFISGHVQNAIDAYKTSIDLHENNYLAWEAMGIAYSKQGNSQNAQKCFERAIKINPGLGSAHHSLGVLNRVTQNHNQAVHYLRLAAALQPKNPMYLEHYNDIMNKCRLDRCVNNHLPVNNIN